MAERAMKKEKPGAALIVALGGSAPKKKAMQSEPSMDMEDPVMGSESAEDLMGQPVREDFEDYAVMAMPELADDPMRLRAFKQAIESVIRAPKKSVDRGY